MRKGPAASRRPFGLLSRACGASASMRNSTALCAAGCSPCASIWKRLWRRNRRGFANTRASNTRSDARRPCGPTANHKGGHTDGKDHAARRGGAGGAWAAASPSSPRRCAARSGPKGMNAIMDRPIGTPIVSRDGVSIASEIELECPFENMGAQVLREVSKQTNEVAGDGTTTATVLADVLVQDGLKCLAAGANPVELVEGLELAVDRDHRGAEALGQSRCRVRRACARSPASRPTTRRSATWSPKPSSGPAITASSRWNLAHRRDDAGSRRGHGLRARLSLASHGHRCREDAGRSRQPFHPDDRSQNSDRWSS